MPVFHFLSHARRHLPKLFGCALALSALFVATGCETTNPTTGGRIVLNRADHDRVIRAELGQIIEVRLPSVPPGELRWDIDRLDRQLTLESPPQFEPPAAGGPTTMGTTVFLFRCQQPGRAMVRLVYRHPWQQAVRGETFLAMVHIRQ